MPRPQPFSRSTNYTDYQTNNPTAPLPATYVDAEMNDILRALQELIDFTVFIQRDDGALKNGVITVDALSQAAFDEITAAVSGNLVSLEQSAAASAAAAEAWAESSTAPGGAGTKSAKTWAGEAASSATAAADAVAAAETDLQTYRDAAQTARTGAETAETNAQGHEAKAQQWAEEAEDTEVEPGAFSALHHAAKAAASAASIDPATLLKRDGSNAMTGALKTDTINEATADAGVTADGVLLKDGGATLTAPLNGTTATLTGDFTGTTGTFSGVVGLGSGSYIGEIATNAWRVTYDGGTGEALVGPYSDGGGTTCKFATSRSDGQFIQRGSVDSNGAWTFAGGAAAATSGFKVTVVADSGASGLTARASGTPLAAYNTNTSGGTLVGFFVGAGSGVGSITCTGSATSYNTSSDYRLKQDVEPLADALDRVLSLPVHRFRWKADPTGPFVDGFLAHEAQAVVPEAVHGAKDEVDADGNPVYQGIDQSKLVPLLTAALQEACDRVDALEARIAALEGAA